MIKYIKIVENNLYINLISLLTLCCTSCSKPIDKNAVIGTYVFYPINFTNDTLIILKNGSYQKRTYSRQNYRLLYINDGKWKLNEDGLTLDDFLLNQDSDFDTDHSYGLMTSILPIERPIIGETRIYEGESYSGVDCYYKKIE